MPSNLEAMERRENPVRAGWRLLKHYAYVSELYQYLNEKTCGTEEIIFWSNTTEDILYYIFKNISKEYMEKVILPWIWEWSKRNERFAFALPYADYIHDDRIKLNIPLTDDERVIVKSAERLEGMKYTFTRV